MFSQPEKLVLTSSYQFRPNIPSNVAMFEARKSNRFEMLLLRNTGQNGMLCKLLVLALMLILTLMFDMET